MSGELLALMSERMEPHEIFQIKIKNGGNKEKKMAMWSLQIDCLNVGNYEAHKNISLL